MKNPGTIALLEGILDYAGLFPPASLPLEKAISNYVAYLQSEDRWILSRFVIPAGLLAELSALAEAYFQPGMTLKFTVLGRTSANRTQFFQSLDDDLAAVAQFRGQHGAHAALDVFETPLPAGELDYQIRTDNLVAESQEKLLSAGLSPFFEVPYGPGWQARASRLFATLSARVGGGFKIRTGGVQAHMVPSAEDLAWALCAARDARVRLKATAGLHHPLRRFDEDVGTVTHGFLNVFIAGALAAVHALGPEDLVQILLEEEPANFRFEPSGISWRDLFASAGQIAAFRSSALVSFGSCSFDEPRVDLQALGLL